MFFLLEVRPRTHVSLMCARPQYEVITYDVKGPDFVNPLVKVLNCVYAF